MSRKYIDVHKDYVMAQIFWNVRQAFTLLMAYMQTTTPYSEAYERAYAEISRLQNELDTLEGIMQDCVIVKFK